MGKKKKRAAGARSHPKQSMPRSKYPWNRASTALVTMAVLLVLGGLYFLNGRPSVPSFPEVSDSADSHTNLLEKRPTLSPAQFSGPVRRAYEIANNIPEVLDKLYCHCRCKENFGHINLLTCYTNDHASA